MKKRSIIIGFSILDSLSALEKQGSGRNYACVGLKICPKYHKSSRDWPCTGKSCASTALWLTLLEEGYNNSKNMFFVLFWACME